MCTVSGLPPWATNWLVDSALLISTSTTPKHLLWVRWDFVQYQADSFLQQQFKGQTDCREPSRSHGSSLYQRTHRMTSSIFILVCLCFHGSRTVCENRENLHPAKISQYTSLSHITSMLYPIHIYNRDLLMLKPCNSMIIEYCIRS